MRSKAVLLLVAAVVVAAVAFFLLNSDGGVPPTVNTGDIDVERPAAPTPEDDDLASVSPTIGGEETRSVAAETGLGETVAEEGEHPWAGKLAGITGRLVEEDGTPIEAMRMELVEFDVSSILRVEHSALSLATPELDEAFTGADGRFLLQGARRNAYHALNIGRGTGRATLRVVEQAIVHGALTDLGDIVLPAFGTIIGVVIDEDGEPVAGARVRAAPVPGEVLQAGILDVRKDIVISTEDMSLGIPSRVFQLYERLPIPTTTSAADGSFRLEGITPGMVSGGADLALHVAGSFGPIDLKAGAEEDVGEIELLFGRTITGQVTDGGGKPVAGVEVAVGAVLAVVPLAILQPAGVTDADGRYSLRGIPEEGSVVGVARRTRVESWIRAEGVGDTVNFSLKTATPIVVKVRDIEGEPVSGAKLIFKSSDLGGDMLGGFMAMSFMSEGSTQTVKTVEVEPGDYEVQNVTHGKWSIEARAEGFAPTFGEVTHQGEGTSLSMVLTRGQMLRVVVVAEGTGEPVAAAHTLLLAPKGLMIDSFAADFTDQFGVAELGPISSRFMQDAKEKASFFGGATVVAEHPTFGTAYADYKEGMTEVIIELPPSCTVTGRVHWAGESPPGLYMLLLRHDDDENPRLQATSPPRTALSGIEGEFRFTGVAPGQYKMLVMERWLDGDPIALIVEQKDPVMLDDREFEVVAGEENFVDIALSEAGAGPTGRFAGRISSNGIAVAGLKVTLDGSGDTIELTTDGLGQFESAEISTMDTVHINISGDVPLSDGAIEHQTVYNDWTRAPAGETKRIDIDLAYQNVIVAVLDKVTREPIQGAEVHVQSERGRRRWRSSGTSSFTDSNGHASVLLPDDSEHELRIKHADYGQLTVTARPDTSGSGKPSVFAEMQPAVVCKGTVIFPETGANRKRAMLQVKVGEDSMGWVQIDAEDQSFEFKGLMPGSYEAQMWTGSGMVTTAFDLGPGGNEDLMLDFANPETR